MIITAVDPLSFTFEPLFAVLAAAGLLVYARAARRYRPGGIRIASFVTGMLLIAASVNSPLETLAIHYWVLAHLVQNALLADLAPPLVMLGLNREMWEALDRRLPRLMRFTSHLGLALLFWLGTWYFIHLASVYEYALRHPQWLNLEHLVLMFAGFMFWAPVVRARWWEDRSPAVLIPYLLAAFVGASFLGLGFTFHPAPVLPLLRRPAEAAGDLGDRGSKPGGIAMTAEQSLVFLTAIAYTLLLLADREQQATEARERDVNTG